MTDYLVCDGAVSAVEGKDALPDGQYGVDWIMVDAPSAAIAMDAARAFDADKNGPHGTLVYDEAHAHYMLSGGTGP